MFVRGLPYSLTEEDVRKIFSKMGEVVSIRGMYRRSDGKPSGVAWIVYDSVEGVEKAKKIIHGQTFRGRYLEVFDMKGLEERDQQRASRGWIGGGGGGRRGGGGGRRDRGSFGGDDGFGVGGGRGDRGGGYGGGFKSSSSSSSKGVDSWGGSADWDMDGGFGADNNTNDYGGFGLEEDNWGPPDSKDPSF